KYSLTSNLSAAALPSTAGRSTGRACCHAGPAGGCPSPRRRRTTRSGTTSVAAATLGAGGGSRTPPARAGRPARRSPAPRAAGAGSGGGGPRMRGVGAVHGVPGGDQRAQPAGPGGVQRLEDEVVVDGVPAARVVGRVVQLVAAERHVPDHQVDAALRQPGVCE